MKACAHCGELFDAKRPNCPHCGADADLTWSNDEAPAELQGGWTEADDDAYQRFLENEGLLDAPPVTAGRPSRLALWLALLAIASISGILWLLL